MDEDLQRYLRMSGTCFDFLQRNLTAENDTIHAFLLPVICGAGIGGGMLGANMNLQLRCPFFGTHHDAGRGSDDRRYTDSLQLYQIFL